MGKVFITPSIPLILASASKIRADILKKTGIVFSIEISNIDDNTITDSTEELQSSQEVVEENSTTEVEEPSIPSKFANKSTEEIIDSYTNLEKELGDDSPPGFK